ncbi:MAG TPA: C-terminal binding protein [Acidimicrobiales bacterium]|nr:C-terminal binding protein [Acidimicrobiales bacterium]
MTSGPLRHDGSLDGAAATRHLPVLAVASGAFTAQHARLVEHVKGRATLQLADVSTPEAIAESTGGADALVVTLQPLRAAHIAAMSPTVSVIGRAGVGLDTIDLAAAELAGISVLNQPTYGTNEVAAHAVAMLLASQRKLGRCDRYVRDGWSGRLELAPMKPLDETTVGIVGCGRIGAATAKMLSGLVERVIVFDPAIGLTPPGTELVGDLKELLARSDAVSLHVPLTPETIGMIDAAAIATMRRGAILVNVARGGVVDETALAAALESGHLGGAALDVFANEPLPADSPLLGAPNALLSPHCASYSERSSWRLPSWTIDDVISWIAERSLAHGNLAVRGTR